MFYEKERRVLPEVVVSIRNIKANNRLDRGEKRVSPFIILGRVSGRSVMSKAQHLRFRARHVSGVTPPPAMGSRIRSVCFEK